MEIRKKTLKTISKYYFSAGQTNLITIFNITKNSVTAKSD